MFRLKLRSACNLPINLQAALPIQHKNSFLLCSISFSGKISSYNCIVYIIQIQTGSAL